MSFRLITIELPVHAGRNFSDHALQFSTTTSCSSCDDFEGTGGLQIAHTRSQEAGMYRQLNVEYFN